MKKLKLNLKDLKVESFDTSKVSNIKKGTVNGNAPWTEANYTLCGNGSTCYDPTCVYYNTCYTCEPPCAPTYVCE